MKEAACSWRVTMSLMLGRRSDSTTSEILFTGYAEDPLDVILQSSDKQVRTLHAPASWHTAQLQLDID